MTAPKNDKARKAWLAGLKDGDSVAVVDEFGKVKDLEPLRKSRRGNGWSLKSAYFSLSTGRAMARKDIKWWIVPITKALSSANERRLVSLVALDRLEAMKFYEWRRFSEEQILAVSAILWPEQAK